MALTDTGPLPVVEAIATGTLTAAVSQHLQWVFAGCTVLLCGTPATCTGLVTDCRQAPKSVTQPATVETICLPHSKSKNLQEDRSWFLGS